MVPWRSKGPPIPRSARASARVFIPAAAVVLLFVAYASLFTDRTVSAVTSLHEGVIRTFGWYYVVIVAGFVVFIVVVGFTRLGDIRLGRDTEEPEFRLRSWLAMLFAAGMGIGLVFWGAAEPVSHLIEPRPGSAAAVAAARSDTDPWYRAEGLQDVAADAGQEALIQTFLHWGLHPWAIYAIVGLAVGYAVHRRGRPVSIRWALEPVFGRYVRGWVGDLIDIVAIVGTLFGVATSLGLGALQIAAGIGVVSDFDPGTVVRVAVISSITLVAVISVVSGLSRGIRWLSTINVTMMLLLLLFVLVTGSTLFLIREFIQSTGLYVQNLFRLSFDVGALQGQEGRAWTASWTTFYWGWWISWAPFVGIFIARISRGRTVKEFVAGVLLVPTLVSFLWFSVLGGAGIQQELTGAGNLSDEVARGEEYALFGLLSGLPGGTAVIIGTLVLIALFFITSSDSGSLVVDMLASGGDPEPPVWSRIFWAVVEGAVAIALLLLAAGAEGLQALQTAAIMAAVPVSVLIIVMCVAIWRQLHAEYNARAAAERRRRTAEVAAHVSRTLVERGMVAEPPADQADRSPGEPADQPPGGRADQA